MSFEVDRRTGIKFKRVLKVGMMVGLIAGVLLMGIILIITVVVKNSSHKKEVAKLNNTIQEMKAEQEKVVEIPDAAEQLESDDWMLTLINGEYGLDEGYVPDLVPFKENYEVDSRIVESAEAMFAAAEEDGMNLVVRSAYRSYETQGQIFQNTMGGWVNSGYTYIQAYEETNLSVALPGHSEHASGLALDIVSASYQELNEEQANTEEAKWLEEHCWEYGFILRYPPEKSDITGIIYEPWHYRYVGDEAAKEIMEQGVTMEEYLGVVKE